MNIFSHWFSTKTERHVNDIQNPWAGLASYEDPESANQKLKFCGRDDEAYDMSRLIMGNLVVTLYGKSGIGKTSLLNAGIFPELRTNNFSPKNIRVGLCPGNYQNCILKAIENSVPTIETIDIIPQQVDEQALDFLWNYFARHRFYNKDGEQTTPVIVLDQFEEIFKNNSFETEVLLRQLDYMNDKDHHLDSYDIDGYTYHYETNFRFVISIREDDLYKLEDCLDNCYLPALKRCRYRLRSLSEQGARDVIMLPVQNLWVISEQEDIIRSILHIVRNKDDNSISTNLLSLVCNRIFVEYSKQGHEDYIGTDFVEGFVKDNPIERFYLEAIRSLSRKEKAFIESRFVDSSNRRNSISEADFKLNIKNGDSLLTGDTRILQRIATSTNKKEYRIELIHDSFCPPISELKRIRKMRRKVISRIFLIAVLALCAGIMTFIYQQNEKKWMLLEIESRYWIAEAEKLINEGDTYLATMLALKALPNDKDAPNRPYVKDADYTIRRALNCNVAKIKGNSDNFRSAFFSPDGKEIISTSVGGSCKIYDVSTGICRHEFDWNVKNAFFFPNNKDQILLYDYDQIILYNRLANWPYRKIPAAEQNLFSSVSLNPEGNKAAIGLYDGSIWILDLKPGISANNFRKILSGHKDKILSASFSRDGNIIVSCSKDKTIRIWDTETGKCINVLNGHTMEVYSASFSPNGKLLASGSEDKTVRIWDVETGKCINCMHGHILKVNSVCFTTDGENVISVSDDGDTRIWNIVSGKCSVLRGQPNVLNHASISPNGHLLAVASENNCIEIWNLNNTKQNVIRSSLGRNATSLASFSYDGKYIAAVSTDKTISIHDLQTGDSIKTIQKNNNDIRSINFSSDGGKIISVEGNELHFWNIGTGDCSKHKFNDVNQIHNVIYSKDGKYIAFDYKGDYLYKAHLYWGKINTNNNSVDQLIYSFPCSDCFSLSSSGKYLVLSDDNAIRIYDTKFRKKTIKIEVPREIKDICVNPDATEIVLSSGMHTYTLNTKTNKIIKLGDRYETKVNDIVYSPKGTFIAVSTDGGKIHLYNSQTKELLNIFTNSEESITSFSFDNEETMIASTCNNNNVNIWHLSEINVSPIQTIIKQAKMRFKHRQFTQDEIIKYHIH